MAEVSITGLAIAAAKSLAQSMATRALDETSLACGFQGQELYCCWGFKGQLRKLTDKFEYIGKFQEEAGNPNHNQLVNLWVQKVKDVAYLAEDVLDEYDIELFRRKIELEKRYKKKFRNFFTHSNPGLFRIRMAVKVARILSKFDGIDKAANGIGLNQVNVASTSSADTSNDDYILSETRNNVAAAASQFVGRENNQAVLLNKILKPDNERHELSTVAIVGMGGVGKTTLARRLYDHEDVRAHFYKRIWIPVSKNFKIDRILDEIAEGVTSRKLDLTNRETMIQELKEKLEGKKLLIVLDDVWNDDKDLWDILTSSIGRMLVFPGSVILTTTRLDEVAMAAKAVKHELKGLSKDESWSLLSQIVFNNDIQPIILCLVEIGKRIVKKCKGLPLAIKVIGRLLQSKKSPDEWEAIEKSELWDLPEGKLKIIPSLLLSFNHLPSPSVKQCFAYCAMVPKGQHVYKNELIGLWLSQGYLHKIHNDRRNVEEIGEENLNILLSHSLLECVSTGFASVGYMMHDLVVDLAVYVCGSDLIKGPKDLCEKEGFRHLVFNSGEDNTISNLPEKKIIRRLRTLGLKGTVIPWNVLGHTRYLRTLFLDRTSVAEVPPDIGLLKHLRFLDVSYNPISMLPDSIGKLYQLQTLILHGCTNMKKLPKVVNKLVSLRHISTTAPMFAWKGLRQLTNLQSLPALCLDNDGEGWSIDELGDLHHLRDEIHIQGLECVTDKEQARKAGFAGKDKVSKLALSWDEERAKNIGGIREEDVLEDFEPYPDITSLELQHIIDAKFPILNKLMEALKGLLIDGENVSGLTLSWTEARDETNEFEPHPNITSLKLPDTIDTEFPTMVLTLAALYDIWLKKTDPNLTSLFESNVNLTSLFEPNPHLTSFFEPNPHFKSLLEPIRNTSYTTSLQCQQEVENFIHVKFPTLVRLMVGVEATLAGKELTLSGGICDEDVLEGLEPHPNITSLEVKNFLGVRFPTWIMEMTVLKEGLRGNRTQLNNLTVVKLLNCSSCQTLPKLGQLPLLKCLILSGLRIKHIGSEFYGGDYLHMPEVVSFQNLRELEISGFRRLTAWMEPPKEAFPHLETLRIKDCRLLKSLPAFVFKSLTSLELGDLNNVESLDIIKYNPGLTSLIMDFLPNIVSLPQELANCRNLKELHIFNFRKLASFPQGLNLDMGDLLHVLSSLRVFEIFYCPNLKKIPINLEECTSLETLLILKCPMIESLPTNISKLRRLLELRINCSSAEHLRSMLESAKDLPLLYFLEIEGFRDEEEMSDYFSDPTLFLRLPSLTRLMLYGHPNIRTLPQQLGLLTHITTLHIWCFDDLEESPAWIHNLSSLDSLVLEHSKKLKSLPSREALQRIKYLRIKNCPLLTERYAKDGGSDWDKISHITNIIIDTKTIQHLGT